MIFESIELYNFRQFKGKTHIVFADDIEKNVTVILGNNTFGKTTLLQAFNWCLYDEAIFDDNSNVLLNLEIIDEMNTNDTESVEVSLKMKSEYYEYIIYRTQEFRKTESGIVKNSASSNLKIKLRDINGNGIFDTVKDSEKEKTINGLLPKELSGYFFFDTERVNNISNKKDLSAAVKGLLGLGIYESSLKHIGDKVKKSTALGKLYASLTIAGDKKAEEALQNVQNFESQKESNENRINELENEIILYNKKKDELEIILRDNADTAALQREKDHCASQLRDFEDQLEIDRKQYFDDFGEKSISIIAKPLVSIAKQYIEQVYVDDKGISDITRDSIMDILNRGKCICGCDIVSGSAAYEYLQRSLNDVLPINISGTVKTFKNKLNNFSNRSDDYYKKILEDHDTFLKRKLKISEIEDRIIEISEQIAGKADATHYEVQLGEVNKTLKRLQSDRDRLITKRGELQSKIDYWQKAYDSLTSTLEKNKMINYYIAYAEAVKSWIEDEYKAKETLVRKSLEDNVNRIFNKMYHGKRSVEISQTYNITLKANVNGEWIETGESEGLKRVKNFAFIAGLEEAAKRKMLSNLANNKAFALSTEPYPLVMDAPFSNTDEEHIKKISNVLPVVAEQVIMFVMNKDWKYAETVLASKIGKSYNLEKKSETLTILR